MKIESQWSSNNSENNEQTRAIIDAELTLVKDILTLARATIASDEQYNAFRKCVFDRFNKSHKRRLLEIIQGSIVRFATEANPPSKLTISEAIDLLSGIEPEFNRIKKAILDGTEPVLSSDASMEIFEIMKSAASLSVVREMLGS